VKNVGEELNGPAVKVYSSEVNGLSGQVLLTKSSVTKEKLGIKRDT